MSTVAAILSSARKKISDTDILVYDNAALIDALNAAIDYMSSALIRLKDGEMIKAVSVPGSLAKPTDFDSVVGSQAIYLENDTVRTLNGGTLAMRYYAMKPHVSATTDTIPFKASIEPLLIQLTAIYALNSNEYNVTQDMALFEKNLSLLQGGGS